MSINQITRITIKNYRSIVDLTVDLPILTVLVGENGSGKSNFIDAIRFLGNVLRFGLNATNDYRNTNPLGSISISNSDETVFDINIKIDNLDRRYKFTFHRYGVKRLKSELYELENKAIFERTETGWVTIPFGLNPPLGDDLFLPLIARQPDIAPVYQFLTNMSFYNIFPDRLRDFGSPAMQPYPLAENGENLASVLHEFLEKSDWKVDFKNSLRNILPHIKDIETVFTGGRILTSFVHQKNSNLPFQIPQSEESDGTLRILAMLTAIYQDPSRTVLGLEEPELFIHASAVPKLCDVIRSASRRSQVIVTTHDLEVIDRFTPTELRIVELTEQGTQIGEIDELQQQTIREKLFLPGELVRIEGLRRAEPVKLE